MRKLFWVLIVLVLILFLFFNPLCGFHGIIPYTAEDGCNTCQCFFIPLGCTETGCFNALFEEAELICQGYCDGQDRESYYNPELPKSNILLERDCESILQQSFENCGE